MKASYLLFANNRRKSTCPERHCPEQHCLTSTDAVGHVTSWQHNAPQRPTQMTEPDPDGGGALTSPEVDGDTPKHDQSSARHTHVARHANFD